MKTTKLLTATSLLLATTMILSCNKGEQPSSPASATSQSTAPQANQTSFVEGRDYTVFERVRFMDTAGFERPAEAFSLLLPRGWKHDGGIVWKNPRECVAEMVGARMSISSPDDAIRFQSLPLHAWSYASDQMMLQSMQMQAQSGGCDVGQPMGAEAYLREVLVPNELSGATVVEVRPNEPVQRELQQQMEKHRAAIMQYGAQQVDFAPRQSPRGCAGPTVPRESCSARSATRS